MKDIMVLNDGETFTDLEGCAIWSVPDDMETDEIELALHDLQEARQRGEVVMDNPITLLKRF